MAVDHYENFPVASVLCPPALRAPIAAVYWFARTADDIADEGHASAAARLEALEAYRADLTSAHGGRPCSGRWPHVFTPLRRVLVNHHLPLQLLEDLLSAFRQDAVNPSYQTRDQLLDYCRRSADPIGRLLLHLYGIDSALAVQHSDRVCSALQLINFWQDLSVDAPRGRCYIPLDDLRRHGLEPADLCNPARAQAVKPVVAELCLWARALMDSGSGIVFEVPGRGGWELRLVVQGGLRVLDRIRAIEHDTARRRPKLRSLDLPILIWRALGMRRPASQAGPADNAPR